MVCTTLATSRPGRAQRMVQGDIGSFDTRFERLTEHYRDAITRGELKPGDRFPSARELSEMHGVGRTTAGRVHGTLISMGLIEHRPGVGTFVLEPARSARSPWRCSSSQGGGAARQWRRSTSGRPVLSRRLSSRQWRSCATRCISRAGASSGRRLTRPASTIDCM